MAFEPCRLVWATLSCVLIGCAAEARFALREPMRADPDLRPFAPAPEEYVSPFVWDGADQIVFRPIANFFAVDPAGRAENVNAYDEVPDSSWFENRIGRKPLSAADIIAGPCGDQVLDPNQPGVSWAIDKGKSNGANPGFRVNVPGLGKFMLKADPAGEPERATGATAIAARIYHAAGYFAPCDSVVHFDPSILRLSPGLTVTDNTGVTRPFDAAMLASLLEHASHRGSLVRMGSSRWLPGKPLGPSRYEGTRSDDPNDVIAHEDRRELRGARLLAAWLNHFDSREQNSMDVFMPVANDPKRELGYVRHYILDLGDCFGSVWSSEELSKRLGFAYYLDFPYLVEDFVSAGFVERPWERARRDAGIFNYFSARDFEPEAWRGGYPNPAFARMTEADGAWMARIIARFDTEHVAAAVSAGQFDAASASYLIRTLLARRMAILQRYLTRLSPWAELQVKTDRLCGTDLARATGVASAPRAPSARARVRSTAGWLPLAAAAISFEAGGQVCVRLPAHARGSSPEAPVYAVLDVDTGSAQAGLRAHLYDVGPKQGYRLVGIERD